MRAGDEAFEALRRAVGDLAEAEAAELVAEARADARAKVRAILAEAMAQALLDRSQAELEGHGVASATAPPRPAAEPAPEPVAPPVPAASPAPATEELGWYLYCVVGEAGLRLPEELHGVDADHAVSVLGDGDLAAVVSRVRLSEFGEDKLRESLNDVAWLEGTARSHERVLDAVRARTTVIPMRLCTIYRTEGSLRETLGRERVAFSEALLRLEAKTEWGLKIFMDPAGVRSAAAAGGELARFDAEHADVSAGEAYMRRRQRDSLLDAQVEKLVDRFVDDAHARMAGLAVEALSNPLQRPEVTGHGGQMVLNGVYLVEDASADAFTGAGEDLAEQYRPLGFDVQVTGPWPPYNFVKSSIEAAW
jgi:hypothetical protein